MSLPASESPQGPTSRNRAIAARGRGLLGFSNSFFAGLALLLTIAASVAFGQDERELWVPTEHLESVIAKMPRAVLLTKEQYDQLSLEFKRATSEDVDSQTKAPVAATIQSAHIEGTVTPGSAVVSLRATYTIESFTDGWTELPLLLPSDHLGYVAVNEQSAIRSGGKKPTTLLTHGQGLHTVAAVYHLPVKQISGGNSITLAALGAPATVDLTFPADAVVASDLPFLKDPSRPGLTSFALPSARGGSYEIRWSAQKIAPIIGAAVLQSSSYVYNLESTSVRADLGLVISSKLAELPQQFRAKVPSDFRVLSVEGSELLRWTQISPGEIELFLHPGDRDAFDLRILLERGVTVEEVASDWVVELPTVTIAGVDRASGTFTLIGSEDVRVKTIETGSLVAPIPDDAEGSLADVPNYVASFSFPVSDSAPRVTLSQVEDRFNAQLDTQINLKREQIEIERLIKVLPREGQLFHIDVSLPESEEFIAAASYRGDFSWKQLDQTTLRLLWENGIPTNSNAEVSLSSRRDPEGWFSLGQDPAELNFTTATIENAEAVSGYLAVGFDPSFKVETLSSESLEIRDARTTPVTGNLAWFRLEDFALTIAASRRPAEIEAAVTAYVLPLTSTLEVEGQLDLAIDYSGITEIDITLPQEVAPLFRFDSPLIAEQTLLAENTGWRLRFHQERTEFTSLPFRAVIPVGGIDEEAPDSAAAVEPAPDASPSQSKTFSATLPQFQIPAAKRLRGHWIVEANTDTELHFEAVGLDRIDSLKVPRVAGYEPRHRVIAAWHYRGDEGRLTLSGTRHQHAEAVTTVVDLMRIDTVASVDGTDRHQARLAVRSAGEQFLELTLPEEAALWSLLVDGTTVKPVRAGANRLRVQLPSDEDGGADITVDVIYQTPGAAWRGSGRETLTPLQLNQRIPVMRTEWLLHLPEGYDYQQFDSNLGEQFEVVDRVLLGSAGQALGGLIDRQLGTSFLYDTSDLASGWTNYSPLSDTEEIPIQPVPTHLQPNPIAISAPHVKPPRENLKGSGAVYAGDRSADQIAASYVIRLQERVKKADEAALRGSQLMADGDYQGSLDQYRAALDLLPEAPMTEPRRRAYTKQFARTSTLLARERADEGRYPEALALIEEVLNPRMDPENPEAKLLLGQLNDPDYYSPALTPQHIERVEKLKLAIKTGQGYIDLGDYDRAEREFHRALNDDPYNTAARRSLEETERWRQNYYDTARDQTRAAFLRDVAEGWEVPVPSQVETGSITSLEDKLKNIIIPNVEFNNTPLRDALQFLQQRSVELDVAEADPSRKGVNLILDQDGETSSGVGSNTSDTPITLRLTNVPLSEALRYTASLAQLKYRVEPNAVVIEPLSSANQDLVTNVYNVPPSFLAGADLGGGGTSAADPFAEPAEGGSGVVSRRRTAKDVLESAGITFGPGSSAAYNAETGQLIVRNNQEQMELVEAYTEPIDSAPSQESDLLHGGVSLSVDFGDEADEFGLGLLEDKIPFLGDLPAVGQLFEQNLDVGNQRSEALSQITLDELNLENQTLAEAARILSERLSEAGGDQFSAIAPSWDITVAGNDAEGVADSESDQKINLRLTKVTVLEALDQIAAATDNQYRVTASGIVIAPRGVPLEPMESISLPVPESEFQTVAASGEIRHRHAREVLAELGIQFPPGSGATYNPGSSRLAIRNTQANLEAVVAHYSEVMAADLASSDAYGSEASTFARDHRRDFGATQDLRGYD
ncbi:MAG: hypothetical protein AAF236_10260, partial [Verrucomicrobiota bacterium]